MAGGQIKRGDRTDTGDNEARGSDSVDSAGSDGPVDKASLAGGPPLGHDRALGPEQMEQTAGDAEIDELTVLEASDPDLGLTNVEGHPAEDWAADTGPTRTAEGEPGTATGDAEDLTSTLEVDRKPDKRGRGGRRLGENRKRD
jgi:hypothetical protein